MRLLTALAPALLIGSAVLTCDDGDPGALSGTDCVPGAGDCDRPVACDPADPHEGCACTAGEVALCFDGAESLIGVGLCAAGQRRCYDGELGACEGQVLPASEVCDGLDQDCDGQADEDLGLACVPCEGDCERAAYGQGTDTPFDIGSGAEGVDVDDGALVLDVSMVDVAFIWIANSDEGTVSKIASATGKEVGRYVSALALPGLPDPLARCSQEIGRGSCPSRTAVDLRGDVWVANRAFGGQGSLTKILATGCPDRNEDGIVSTSSDVDGDGRINLGDPAEFLGVDDECLELTVPVGEVGSLPRALAIDPFHPEPAGSVWVGAFNQRRMFRIHGGTGEIMETVDVPIRPYGAVMTRQRVLWVTPWGDQDPEIVSIDSASGRLGARVRMSSTTGCFGGYGIAVDDQSRIWLGGWSCEAAFRYDPARDSWRTFRLDRQGFVRGIAVDADGYVWTAHSHEAFPPHAYVARVSRFKADDGSELEKFELPDASETIGIGIDDQGRSWAVNRRSANATRIDPASGEMLTIPVGDGPYTYSDFTGFGLRRFTAPFGTWTSEIEACSTGDVPTWDQVAWEADEPDGTSVSVWLRSAARAENLRSAPRQGPFGASPVDLSELDALAQKRHLRVEVELRTRDAESGPALLALHVQYRCPEG